MIGAIELLCVGDPDWTAKIAAEMERRDRRFDVITEQSPREGLDLMEERGVDGVVSAYDLPEQTGVELLRAVRELHPDLPFVIVAEEGSEQISEDAISAGVTDYVIEGTSPYSIVADRLIDLVEADRTRQIVDAAQSGWERTEERANDVYYMFASDWSELLYINSAYESVWGGSIEELREHPRSFLAYVHPDDRDIAVRAMNRLSSGVSTDVEYRVQPPSGEVRWVRGVGEPIFNAKGDVIRIVGSVRDISRLKERERRFHAVFEESFDAMVIANDDGDYVAANDAACELFGLEKEELLGRNIAEFAAHDFDVERAWADFRATDRETGQFPLERPDGTVRIVEYGATPDIVPGEHLSVLRDVTERETQRRALEESEARYETLVEDVLDTSSVATVILDADFDVVWVNSAVEDYFGIERSAVLGKGGETLIRTDLKHKFARPERFARKVIETYGDNTYTEQFDCKIWDDDTGAWRWLKHWSQPIRSGLYEGGRIEHYTDVTRIEDRDRQLQVLERVLRHNLHNGMNVVLGFAETIAADASGETGRQAEQIVRAAEDLLALSDKEKRIVELVRNNYERQSVELAGRIRRTTEELREEHPNADITTRLPPEARVRAVDDIERAVVELIENAIEHSGGAPEIAVAMSATPDHVTVSIRDHNTPIPELEKSIVHGDEDIDQLAHGRGLGLWLVRWLVTRSNGRIAFGRVQRGNDVRIRLPASDPG